jgi:hypothetical protein
MRNVTAGGLPGSAVAGTLSILTTGRAVGGVALRTPYSLPPAAGCDGACAAPAAVGLCARAGLCVGDGVTPPASTALAGAAHAHASATLEIPTAAALP